MEPAITGHEAVDHNDLLVHTGKWTGSPGSASRRCWPRSTPTTSTGIRSPVVQRGGGWRRGRIRVMLDAWQDEVRPVDAPLDGTVIPHLQLEASPAAPEPALTGAPATN